MIFSVPVLSFGTWAFNALILFFTFMIIYWVVKFIVSIATGG